MNKKREYCAWCGNKSIGTDKTGFKSCVKCSYTSDFNVNKLSVEEKVDKCGKIYNELICGKSNPNLRFVCLCTRFKGHKGNHKDSEHPDFSWADEELKKDEGV